MSADEEEINDLKSKNRRGDREVIEIEDDVLYKVPIEEEVTIRSGDYYDESDPDTAQSMYVLRGGNQVFFLGGVARKAMREYLKENWSEEDRDAKNAIELRFVRYWQTSKKTGRKYRALAVDKISE